MCDEVELCVVAGFVGDTEDDEQVLEQLSDGEYIQPYLVQVHFSTTSIRFPQHFSVPIYLHS